MEKGENVIISLFSLLRFVFMQKNNNNPFMYDSCDLVPHLGSTDKLQYGCFD